MAYNPKTQKAVLISVDSHALLQDLMALDDRGQQQELDYLIKTAHKRKAAKV